MKFKVGDKVKIRDGVNKYGITRPGCKGTIIYLSDDSCATVDFSDDAQVIKSCGTLFRAGLSTDYKWRIDLEDLIKLKPKVPRSNTVNMHTLEIISLCSREELIDKLKSSGFVLLTENTLFLGVDKK